MRFGFKTTIEPNGPLLELHDIQIWITTKEDYTGHKRTISGKWCYGWIDEKPFVRDVQAMAHAYIEENEYIKTDDDFYIPRCDIKCIRFQETNHWTEQPLIQYRGFKDWTVGEWLTTVFFGLVVVAIISILTYIIIKGA